EDVPVVGAERDAIADCAMSVPASDLVVELQQSVARQVVAGSERDIVLGRVNRPRAQKRDARMSAGELPVDAFPVRGDIEALGDAPADAGKDAMNVIVERQTARRSALMGRGEEV